jgi:ribosomal protein L33
VLRARGKNTLHSPSFPLAATRAHALTPPLSLSLSLSLSLPPSLPRHSRRFFYTATRPRVAEKLVFRKYDPVVRQHVLFKETKKK